MDMAKAQSALAVAAALALGGCQGLGALPLGPGPGLGAAAPATQVSYAGGGALEVVSTDPRPITRVEVVGPAGPITASVSVHRETVDPTSGQSAMAPPPAGPSVGVGFGAGRWSRPRRSGSGVYLGVSPYGYPRPFGYPGYGPAYAPGYGSPDPGSGAMRSTARVTLDDPVAYERQWRSATVRVRFGDDSTPTELPAPPPSR